MPSSVPRQSLRSFGCKDRLSCCGVWQHILSDSKRSHRGSILCNMLLLLSPKPYAGCCLSAGASTMIVAMHRTPQKEEVCSTEPHSSAVTHTKAVPSRSAMLPRSRTDWARTLRRWQGLNSSGFTAVNVGAFIARIGFWAPLYCAYNKEP